MSRFLPIVAATFLVSGAAACPCRAAAILTVTEAYFGPGILVNYFDQIAGSGRWIEIQNEGDSSANLGCCDYVLDPGKVLVLSEADPDIFGRAWPGSFDYFSHLPFSFTLTSQTVTLTTEVVGAPGDAPITVTVSRDLYDSAVSRAASIEILDGRAPRVSVLGQNGAYNPPTFFIVPGTPVPVGSPGVVPEVAVPLPATGLLFAPVLVALGLRVARRR